MDTQRLASLEEKLAALQSHLERLQWKFRCPKCGYGHRSTALADLNPRQAMLHFLKQSDAPMGIRALKKKLAEGGYPMDRFGPRHKYFYTLLGRLQNSELVARDGDELMLVG